MKHYLPVAVLLLLAVILTGCEGMLVPMPQGTGSPSSATALPPLTSPLATSLAGATSGPVVGAMRTITQTQTSVPQPAAAPPSAVSDLKSFVAELRKAGLTVEPGGNISGSVFTGSGQYVLLEGAEVQAYEYPDAAAASLEAARVSPTGDTVGGASVGWEAPPHFYQQGRLLVIYLGDDQATLALLKSLLGSEVAGAGVVSAEPTPSAGAEATPAEVASPATAEPTGEAVASPVPDCTNLGRMVADVTIPDNTVIQGGETFTKTWRLRNVGTCPWDSSYSLVYVKGERMGAHGAIPIPSAVEPGTTVEISAVLTAPDAAGTYRSNWQLRDPAGEVFAIDNSQDGTFWVQIIVRRPAASTNSTPSTTLTERAVLPLVTAVRERIAFPAGSSSTTLTFTLDEGQTKEYVLRASAGQRMRIIIDQAGLTLEVVAPNGERLGRPLTGTSGRVEYMVPATGEYVISVQGEGTNSVTVELSED